MPGPRNWQLLKVQLFTGKELEYTAKVQPGFVQYLDLLSQIEALAAAAVDDPMSRQVRDDEYGKQILNLLACLNILSRHWRVQQLIARYSADCSSVADRDKKD